MESKRNLRTGLSKWSQSPVKLSKLHVTINPSHVPSSLSLKTRPAMCLGLCFHRQISRCVAKNTLGTPPKLFCSPSTPSWKSYLPPDRVKWLLHAGDAGWIVHRVNAHGTDKFPKTSKRSTEGTFISGHKTRIAINQHALWSRIYSNLWSGRRVHS